MKNSADIKQNLHYLIDKIDNNELLEIAYELLSSKAACQEGELIKTLTVEKKRTLRIL